MGLNIRIYVILKAIFEVNGLSGFMSNIWRGSMEAVTRHVLILMLILYRPISLCNWEPIPNHQRWLLDIVVLIAVLWSELCSQLQPTAGKDAGNLPQHTDRARVKHQRKRKLHRVSEPSLGESSQKMSMGNENNVGRVLAMHAILLECTNLPNQIINAVGNLLSRPTNRVNIVTHSFQESDAYSPPSQPSRQISHGRSESSPRSFRSARISRVKRPS